MKRLPRFCLLFITVVLAVALLAGCGNPPADTGSQGNSGGIEGIVTDCGGNPVAGMTALIVSGTAGFPEIAAAMVITAFTAYPPAGLNWLSTTETGIGSRPPASWFVGGRQPA